MMVEGVPAAIGARGGALGLVEGDELVIVDPRGAKGQTLRPGARLPLTARAPITTAAREGKPTWVQRRAEFVSKFAEGAALAPYASGALAVPVFVGERLAGAMGFPFQRARTRSQRRCERWRASRPISVGRRSSAPALYELERSSREALDRILAVAPRFQQGATLGGGRRRPSAPRRAAPSAATWCRSGRRSTTSSSRSRGATRRAT